MWIYIFKPKKSEDTHENQTWMEMVKLKQNFEKSPRLCTWKRPGYNGNLYFIVKSVKTNSDSSEN